MTTLVNHPGKFLNDGAAASLARMESAHGGAFAISDAGRTEATQQSYIDRWDKGGAANRPPFLYSPGRPASNSPHVADGGRAIDVTNADHRAWIKAHGGSYGWRFNIPSDIVHVVYESWLDQHAGGGSTAPAAGYSETVRNEQNWLNVAFGEHLVADGVRGPATIAAYKRYQQYLVNYGYKGAIDGVWGDGTQKAHAAFYEAWHNANKPVATTPQTTLSFKDIQAGLNKFGYGLVVDGIWGKRSSNALADFQSKHGLTVDRLVGPKTRAALSI